MLSRFSEASFLYFPKSCCLCPFLFLTSVYIFKSIFSSFSFRWSWSLPSITILTWGKFWRVLCGGKFSAFSVTFPPAVLGIDLSLPFPNCCWAELVADWCYCSKIMQIVISSYSFSSLNAFCVVELEFVMSFNSRNKEWWRI